MNKRHDESKSYQTQKSDWLASNWAGMLPPDQAAAKLQPLPAAVFTWAGVALIRGQPRPHVAS